MATISGQVITRTGRYREQIWMAWFFMTLSTGLLIMLDDHANQWDNSSLFRIMHILSVFVPLGPRMFYSCFLVLLELVLCFRRASSHKNFGRFLMSNPQTPLIALQAAMPLKDMAVSTGAFMFIR